MARYLCPEEYMDDNQKFLEEQGIKLHQFMIDGNKVGCVTCQISWHRSRSLILTSR